MSEIFNAIADPVRRTLIARLHQSDALSLSQLAEGLSITRQAVTKHLNQLHKAGLVQIERRGRERLHSLDPKPLAEIDAWLEPYSAAWDRRLERLGRHLEATTAGEKTEATKQKPNRKETKA